MRLVMAILLLWTLNRSCLSQEIGRLPDSEPLLPGAGDLHGQRQQVFDYFQSLIEAAESKRDQSWRPAFSLAAADQDLLDNKRTNLREMLGLIQPDPIAERATVELLAEVAGFQVDRVTIPIDKGLAARGLLFSPATAGKKPAVIICPDADAWPERLMGLDGQHATTRQVTSFLDGGSVVYVQQSIERLADHPYCSKTRGKDRRAILYRLGYVVGRTMPGLDVQDTLAAVGFLANHDGVNAEEISLYGHGQGGMTALMTAALDRRVSSAWVSDYFDQRNRCWAEPVDRRLRGQLVEFGDAELAALIAPRKLTVEASDHFLSGATNFNRELDRATWFYEALSATSQLTTVKRRTPNGSQLLALRVPAEKTNAIRNKQFEERLSWLRKQIAESEAQRYARWGILEKSPDHFPAIQQEMLEDYQKMVGRLPSDGSPMTVRSELGSSNDLIRIYRITIDVVPGVRVYGNLAIPQNIERRCPAVICQHGFGGYPHKITGLGMQQDTGYHEYGRKLAEKGYVVFAPMSLHIQPSEEVSRQMRQANAVDMMRLAMPLAKTERVIEFLESLPFVDNDRIAYYGLSYGGYSALWMSPLSGRLAAIVCSGNFNDWRTKITSDDLNTSYLRHPDEDMYSWNCLNRFTHPELIAMVAPRPFCVEYGIRDGITTPEWTAYAWKQTEVLFDHIGLFDRIRLAQFAGPHEIHGVETFDFLDQWLKPNE